MLTRHILQTDEPGSMFTESVLTGRLQRHETVRALWKRSGPFFQSALVEAGERFWAMRKSNSWNALEIVQ